MTEEEQRKAQKIFERTYGAKEKYYRFENQDPGRRSPFEKIIRCIDQDNGAWADVGLKTTSTLLKHGGGAK